MGTRMGTRMFPCARKHRQTGTRDGLCCTVADGYKNYSTHTSCFLRSSTHAGHLTFLNKLITVTVKVYLYWRLRVIRIRKLPTNFFFHSISKTFKLSETSLQ